MKRRINRLTLRGFKSIEALESFELRSLNVLIGANGAGKSNFVDLFRLLRVFADEALQEFVLNSGGGDGFLFLGPKVTNSITARLDFELNSYEFTLKPTASGTLQVADERGAFNRHWKSIGSGNLESQLKTHWNRINPETSSGWGVPQYIFESVSSWTVYHFHDTSALAPMRRDQSLRDMEKFRHDASNIASFLLGLKQTAPGSYSLVRDTVRLIAPFFDDFLLRIQKRGAEEQVRLEWQQRGSDFPFQPNHLSDGTIRFICLAVALLQPDLPATIVIDEPELGLHPYAISILADLIKSASERTQVIISTQSSTLLNYFAPGEIVVVNRREGRSTFERLEADSLAGWMEDYSVGELWQKNVVQGGPNRE